VAEGVTGIPDGLCIRGYERGNESLETVVFSKSVTVIRHDAFHYCTNLRSVIFPNDPQLREIGIFPVTDVNHCKVLPFQTASLQSEDLLLQNVPTLNQ
jgi:hypothetical protein